MIRPRSEPLLAGGSLAVVRGNLAPCGAVIKTSAASANLLKHRGPAVVFESYDDMLARVNDPATCLSIATACWSCETRDPRACPDFPNGA